MLLCFSFSSSLCCFEALLEQSPQFLSLIAIFTPVLVDIGVANKVVQQH
jgi:hypothetical protein